MLSLKAGDFTGLAKDYSLHRPDYCPSVLNSLLGLMQKAPLDIDFVDIGAGTGIWTRMVYQCGLKSVTAVEPNEDMRNAGVLDCEGTYIRWLSGSAEKTGLPDSSADMITMASSFHWTNFDLSTKEFHRLLRPNGRFTALWNPRYIEANLLLVEIEDYLGVLLPNFKRVSSGRSGITEMLAERLWNCPFFEDVVYLEGRHIIHMNPERYLGAWRSVNDLQVQLGFDKFNNFLDFVEKKISGLDVIETTYLTRAWSSRKKD